MENMNIKTIAAFFTGFAVGVVVAEKYFAKNYERLVETEIESVKEVYRNKEKALEKKYDRKEYMQIVEDSGYSEDAYENVERPYVIKPEEFGENDDYNQVSLTYYIGNGVVTDENDEPLENVEDTIGSDYVQHFGEYEEDSVYVRNDRRRTDYEILLDTGDWSSPY
jgi:hypothetical protein